MSGEQGSEMMTFFLAWRRHAEQEIREQNLAIKQLVDDLLLLRWNVHLLLQQQN
jgi:hypothetical protein